MSNAQDFSDTIDSIERFRVLPQQDAQHIYHHSEPTKPHVNVSMERNSRGVTWGATVSGCESVAEAMRLLDETVREMSQRYGVITVVT